MMLMLLNLIDGLLTWIGLTKGYLGEVNCLLSWMPPDGMLLIKTLLGTFLIWFLNRNKHMRFVKWSMQCLTVLYSIVIVYHIILIYFEMVVFV